MHLFEVEEHILADRLDGILLMGRVVVELSQEDFAKGSLTQ